MDWAAITPTASPSLDHTSRGKALAVALRTNAALRLTGQWRAYLHCFNGRFFHQRRDFVADQVARCHEYVTCLWMHDVVQRNPTYNPIAQWLDDLLVLLQRLHFDSAQGSAIFLIDDDILCHIHQTTRQIACIRGLECGIGQSLTRSVRGDEILQNGKSFLKV